MGTVGGAVMHHLLEALGALGLDQESLGRSASVDLSGLMAPGARLSWRDAVALLAAAERLSGDPLLGLHAAESSVSRGVLGVLLRSQPNVFEALRQLDRFETLIIDDLDVTLEQRPRVSALTIQMGSGDLAAERHMREYLAGSIVIELSLATRRPFRPTEVRFPHPPAAAKAEYERVLGCPVRFRQPRFEILFPDAFLRAPLGTNSPEAAELLEVEVRHDLELATSARFASRVEAALRTSLARGEETTAKDVGRRMGASTRTLQRRLAEEQTSFRQVRDAALRERALERLQQSSLAISELAAELGFGNVAAFSKAFKRWTGETPSARRSRSARRVASSEERREPEPR